MIYKITPSADLNYYFKILGNTKLSTTKQNYKIVPKMNKIKLWLTVQCPLPPPGFNLNQSKCYCEVFTFMTLYGNEDTL